MGARRKASWGGPRTGAGRRALAGEARRNRVVVLVKDEELEKLRRLAGERRLPVGTVAYELLAKALRRRK